MGLIAQEVEKVLPEWIQEDQDGYKAMRISGFEALVVEAFKELTVINTKLSERVNTLERKLMKLEKCVQLQMHTMNEHY